MKFVLPKISWNKVLIVYFVMIVPALIGAALGIAMHKLHPPATTASPIVASTPVPSTVGTGKDFLAVLSCFTSGIDNKCLDDFVKNYAGGSTDIKALLAAMEANRATNVTVENQCHPIAHAIGRYDYEVYGNIGDAFLACDQSCHSGCYHGVMERLFYTPAQLESNKIAHLTFADMQAKVPHICDATNFKNPSQPVIFQCLHGVGHAILFSLDYNLEDALKSCDLLPTDYDQSSCYGGVIMENVTAADTTKRDLKADDPQYPCDKLADKYKYSCYLMQTSVMSGQGLSTEQIAAECLKAGTYSTPCFISMGRDMSNSVRTGQSDIVIHACEDISAGNTASCTDGTVYALIDNTWDVSFAFPFCGLYKSADNRRQCFEASSSYAEGVYSKTHDELVQDCTKYAGDKLSECQNAIS